MLPDLVLGAGAAAVWSAARQTWPLEATGQRQIINRQQIPEQGIDGDTCSARSKYGDTGEGNSTAEGTHYKEMTLEWSSVC